MLATTLCAGVGTACSLAFTVSLGRRWWRSRRLFLGAWTVSLTCFTLGLAGLGLGSAIGFDPAVFRGYYLTGGLLAAAWLGVGEVALVARARRFAELALYLALLYSLLGTIVVLAAPLAGPVEGSEVPDGSVLFGAFPRVLLALGNSAGTLAVLGGVLVSFDRSRGGGLAARRRLSGVVLIATGVLLAASAGTAAGLGVPAAQPAVLALGVAVMYAGFRRTVRRVGRHAVDLAAQRRAVRQQARDRRLLDRVGPLPPPTPLPDLVLAAAPWPTGTVAAGTDLP